MSRVQLALNVDNLDEAITFYSTLFNTQPAKVKEGYANFAIAEPPLKLILQENPGKGGTINHLGVEVDSSDQVHTEIARLTNAGMFTEEEIASTCCFATQDKVWVTGPGGESGRCTRFSPTRTPSAPCRSHWPDRRVNAAPQFPMRRPPCQRCRSATRRSAPVSYTHLTLPTILLV